MFAQDGQMHDRVETMSCGVRDLELRARAEAPNEQNRESSRDLRDVDATAQHQHTQPQRMYDIEC